MSDEVYTMYLVLVRLEVDIRVCFLVSFVKYRYYNFLGGCMYVHYM